MMRAAGFTAERGGPIHRDDKRPDVVHDIPGVHIEVKRTERLDLYGALAQAEGDAADGELPVVAFRRNGDRWRAILPLDALVELLRLRAIVGEFKELT